MTRNVQELLEAFDHLPEDDNHEAAAQILRRVSNLDFDPVSDDQLVFAAEALFLELDVREAVGGQT